MHLQTDNSLHNLCYSKQEKSTSSSILLGALKRQFVFLGQLTNDTVDRFGHKTKVITYFPLKIWIISHCYASSFKEPLIHEEMPAPFSKQKRSLGCFFFCQKNSYNYKLMVPCCFWYKAEQALPVIRRSKLCKQS